MSSFECTKCGACCRAIGAFPTMDKYDRGDGVCKHLTPANLCAIYETRPKICRVDVSRPAALTASHWNASNHEACKRLHLLVYGQELR